MRGLPGWRPMTASGVVLALTGLAMLAVGLCLAFLYGAVGSDPAAGGFALVALMGYGFQLALLGSAIAVVSLVIHWFGRGLRACPMWRSAP